MPRAGRSILPAKLTSKHFVRSREKSFTAITQASWEHPIFSTFKDIQRSAVSASQFFGYWDVQPSEPGGCSGPVRRRSPGSSRAGRPAPDGYSCSLLRSMRVGRTFRFDLRIFRSGRRRFVLCLRLSNPPLPLTASDRLWTWLRATEPGTSGAWNVIDPTGKRRCGAGWRPTRVPAFEIAGTL